MGERNAGQDLTLPFTEDYIFQIAAGSQQMYSLVIDVERAGIRPLPADDELAALTSLASCSRAMRDLPEVQRYLGAL